MLTVSKGQGKWGRTFLISLNLAEISSGFSGNIWDISKIAHPCIQNNSDAVCNIKYNIQHFHTVEIVSNYNTEISVLGIEQHIEKHNKETLSYFLKMSTGILKIIRTQMFDN